jgi:chromosome transmission fidelity protein 4
MQEKTLPHPALAHASISQDEVDELFGERRRQNGARRQGNIDDMDRDDEEDRISDLDDFVIDDEGAEHPERGAGRRYHDQHLSAMNGGANLLQQLLSGPQQAFQPGSTPYKYTNTSGGPLEGERRYLAFNMIGVIYTIFQGTHSVVNVEFHDKSQNRNFHFQDYFNYSLASLGKKGAVFAVESSESVQTENDEDGEQPARNPSRIYYRPLGGLADNAEWSMRLPDGEEVIGKSYFEF